MYSSPQMSYLTEQNVTSGSWVANLYGAANGAAVVNAAVYANVAAATLVAVAGAFVVVAGLVFT